MLDGTKRHWQAEMAKKIAPAAVQCLKDALTNVYWYKSELRSFLSHTLSDPVILGRLNWEDYKRNIVGTLVDHLARHEEVYQRDLIRLMDEVSKVDDFSHLERLDDGRRKADAAKKSVAALKKQIAGFRDIREEEQEVERRRQAAQQRLQRANEVQTKLQEIVSEYVTLLSKGEPQARGFKLGRCPETGGTQHDQAVSRDVMRIDTWGRSSPLAARSIWSWRSGCRA